MSANDLSERDVDAPAFRFAEIDADCAPADLARPEPAEADLTLCDLVADVRFLAIGSRIAPRIKDLVSATFGPIDIYSIERDSIRCFSSQAASFSIIVVLFDDITRAKRALREHKWLLDNKLCYAIMTKASPGVRASLMRFVFDDVFDARTKPAEIIFRMKSHARRQLIYNHAVKNDESLRLFCDENIAGRVHASQMEILRQLYNNMGAVVRYRDLAAYDYHAGDFRYKSLKVRIHNLRKRLKNHDIICERGRGYALVERDG